MENESDELKDLFDKKIRTFAISVYGINFLGVTYHTIIYMGEEQLCAVIIFDEIAFEYDEMAVA
ncbi:hypothetical protein [Sphingobacterium sp. WOUb80]|uniref:hypothetical protein n=1 Tax=Sphingobacterium sp. WOUb80 TaxID=3234028 RepID=UPI003CFB07E3